jgi:hypothetical protein
MRSGLQLVADPDICHSKGRLAASGFNLLGDEGKCIAITADEKNPGTAPSGSACCGQANSRTRAGYDNDLLIQWLEVHL